MNGVTTRQLREYIQKHWPRIKLELQEGTYKPSPVRKVEIPKPDGGVRILGIPTVIDRLIQQGDPLRPLLANILLDDFDKELERRGLRFCCYADDCNTYVRTKRAGERVKQSITRYLEKRLRLKVNEAKSAAVDHPWKRKFLGFSFHKQKMVKVRIAPKSLKRVKDKIREITNPTWSMNESKG